MNIKIKNEDDINNFETVHSKRLHSLAYEELQKHTISKTNNLVDKLDLLYIDKYKNEMLSDLKNTLKSEDDDCEPINSKTISIDDEIQKTKVKIKILLLALKHINEDLKLKWNIDIISNVKTRNETLVEKRIKKYRNF